MLNRLVFLSAFALFIAGCTSNQMYRHQVMGSPQAVTGDCTKQELYRDTVWSEYEKQWVLRDDCSAHSIERLSLRPPHVEKETDLYSLFFVELDEQGRFFDDAQLDAISKYLADNKGNDLSIVTFVHGWRNNAEANNANVRLARETLLYTYLGEKADPHPNPSDKPRKVVGIYVGWRGLSTTGPLPWELISVWDRKNTAQNVAVGSIRELFSLLRVYQDDVNADAITERRQTEKAIADAKQMPASSGSAIKYESNCLDPEFVDSPDRAPYHCKRVRLMIVGHSFGGLMVYNAVSGALIDSVTRGSFVHPSPENCHDEFGSDPNARTAIVRSFADLIVLVNPAVEGARFEPLHQAVARRARKAPGEAGAFCPNQRPVFVSITSKFDYATRWAFWAARGLNTVLESSSPWIDGRPKTELEYLGSEEYTASINTLGHVERFHTHLLKGNTARLNEWKTDKKTMQPDNLSHEKAYLDKLQSYCQVRDKAFEESEQKVSTMLRMCRCEPERWQRQIDRAIDDSQTSDAKKSSCPAYVEEVNAAEMIAGAGDWSAPELPWMPQAAASGGTSVAGAASYRGAGWIQSFCGGAAVQHLPFYPRSRQFKETRRSLYTEHSPSSPVWNVYSEDEEIIDGHSDLRKNAFKTLLQQLYHTITIRQFDADSFGKLREQARKNVEEHCTPVSPRPPEKTAANTATAK